MNHKHRTKFISKEEAIRERKCFLFDAKGKILGRFASEIAKVLQGKHKTNFTPNQNMGDAVVVINVEHLVLTKDKAAQKKYYRHSGHVGALKEIPYSEIHEKDPGFPLKNAVKKMLPKTKLGRAQIKNMHLFKGDSHNMQAQKPIPVTI